ncbi:unnamed protein product [Sphagnum troendelagicum]
MIIMDGWVDGGMENPFFVVQLLQASSCSSSCSDFVELRLRAAPCSSVLQASSSFLPQAFLFFSLFLSFAVWIF